MLDSRNIRIRAIEKCIHETVTYPAVKEHISGGKTTYIWRIRVVSFVVYMRVMNTLASAGKETDKCENMVYSPNAKYYLIRVRHG